MAVVRVSYYTDPACPWSWALEPALRKLLNSCGADMQVSYVMSGMASEFGDALKLISEALEASAATGMPVDPRLWLQAPPGSSFPACIAVKAAAEQHKEAPYLRRLREGFMCRRRKLDTTDALLEEARAIGDIDLDRFKIDLGSHAILEAFGSDLERAQAAAARPGAQGDERVPLPSLEFSGEDGEVHGVYGFSSYEQLHGAAQTAGVGVTARRPPDVLEALSAFGALATAEVAQICELPGPRASAELWRLATEWAVKSERLGSGELWTLA